MSSATPTRHTARSQVNAITQRVVFSPSKILVGHMVVTSALEKVPNQTVDKNTKHDHGLCFYHLVWKSMCFLTKYVVANKIK